MIMTVKLMKRVFSRWYGASILVTLDMNTVNVEIFAQYIFSHISRRVLGARNYDVSEKMNHYSANRINC